MISFYLWYKKTFGHRNKLLSKFAAPKSYPILNNSVHIIGKTPAEIFQLFAEFSKKYGPVWRFQLNPFVAGIYIRDPKVIEEILSSQKHIDKANEYDMLHGWLGTGLILSSGKKWQQRRKIITPAFHFKILEQFVDVMEKHAETFVGKLKSFDGQKIDIFSIISLYTLDVICESAMGYELNAQLDDTSEYVKAVKEITGIYFKRMYDSRKRINFIYKFTSMYQREKVVTKKLQDFTLTVINARRKYWKELGKNEKLQSSVDDFGVKKKTAFLDLLLQSKIDGVLLDDTSIREEVDTFMFAGHDTTSTAISFALLNLAKNPEIQQLVFEESKEVFENCSERTASMQDLNKMVYLEKVIKESLRLFPPVPSYSRKFREDVVLGGYTFPANVSTKIQIYAMARDPNLFSNPLKFDPSRFDDDMNIKLFSYVPFSAGPRNCIGQKFGMLEIKSIITKIIRDFRILVDKEDENPSYAQEIILRPDNGINLRFKPRSDD